MILPENVEQRKIPELDTTFVRSQFPAFSQPDLQGWGFFENAGGSYTCRQVIDKLQQFYTETKVQPYAPYPASEQAGLAMDFAYSELARYLNVSVDWISLGPSTSQNTYVLAQAFGDQCSPGDEIIVTNQDHEANIGVWRRLEKRGVRVLEWQVDPDSAQLNAEDLYALVTDKTKLVAFTHCSNIVGHINPVASICRQLRNKNIITVVDGVSHVGHGFPDIAETGADIYLFSLYKTYGPHLGLMAIRPQVQEFLQAQCHFFNQQIANKRFVPAGPDHAQIASAAGVAGYFDAVDLHHFPKLSNDISNRPERIRNLFRHHEKQLMEPLLSFVRQCDNIQLIGPCDLEQRHPTISLKTNSNPADIVKKMSEKRLMCSAGHFYAYRLIKALGIDPDSGVLRLSFVHYTTRAEITSLIEGLQELL